MNILGVGWIGLVSDRPQTRRFYKQVLGLRLIEQKPAYAYYTINAATHLEVLSTASRLAGRQRADAPAIGFRVDHLDNAVQELGVAGVELRSGIEEWRSDNEQHRWVCFDDPEGHTLLLLERRRI